MSNSNSVRSVIELFCKILSDNSVYDVDLRIRAETLRQAKFNNPIVISQLWKLIGCLICYCKGKALSYSQSSSVKGEEILKIKSQLQRWGYLDQSFGTLTQKSSDCSRQLLLVLGWIVQKQKVINKIISRRKSPLEGDLISFTGTKPMRSEAQFLSIPKARGQSDKDELTFAVLLCGKLRQAMKRLHATQQLCAKLKDRISGSTVGVGLQPQLDHLTPLEVHLLKDKQGLKKMMTLIDADNEQLNNLLEWKEKENIFWEWMDSVLALHLEQMTSAQDTSDLDVEQVFLPVSPNIGRDITETRSKLRDLILNHEGHIEQMETLFHSKKMTKSELEWIKHVVDREIAALSHSLNQCDHEIFPQVDGSDPTKHSDLTTEPRKLMVSNSQQAGKPLKKIHCETEQKVKEKIVSLEKTVNELEIELQSLQAQSLQKLQSHIIRNPSIICIQPTALKHLFES